MYREVYNPHLWPDNIDRLREMLDTASIAFLDVGWGLPSVHSNSLQIRASGQ